MFVFKGLSCFNTILSYANTALKFLHSKNFIYALQEAIKAKNKTVWQYRIIPWITVSECYKMDTKILKLLTQ